MAVVIRMKRIGRKNRPSYRISVADARAPRDGRTIETLGFYDPMAPRKEEQLKLDPERCRHWLGVGALYGETVASIFRRNGVALPAHKRTERPGRGKKTATRERRRGAKAARVSRKGERRTARLAARRAAQKAAAAQKGEVKEGA